MELLVSMIVSWYIYCQVLLGNLLAVGWLWNLLLVDALAVGCSNSKAFIGRVHSSHDVHLKSEGTKDLDNSCTLQKVKSFTTNLDYRMHIWPLKMTKNFIRVFCPLFN